MMNRPKPHTHVVAGEQMFAYYNVHEINEYLAYKDMQLSLRDKEIQKLKRANEELKGRTPKF
jgi:hypothetical protein